MRFDAVIFDLDGTLADTLEDIAAAVNHALALHGVPTHPRERYRALVGEGVDRLVERALPARRQDLHQPVYAAVRDHYAAHMLDKTQPYEGVPAMLEALERRGVAMAVLSNKPAPATERMVRELFPGTRFEAVVGHTPELVHKPDPGSALEIARHLRVQPSRCLYLGDTSTDMQTAVAAGMVPVGALWGFREREELEAHGARVVIGHPAELIALVDGAPS